MVFQIEQQPFDDLRDLIAKVPTGNAKYQKQALKRQMEIALPSGELGRLAELAVWLSTWQGQCPPTINKPQVIVFASSHGVAKRGVSAYGMAQTISKIEDLTSGKGGVNQIAGTVGCGLKIVELAPELPTPDITAGAALSEQDCAATFAFGMEAISEKPDLIGIGAVGAGATTSAAAVSLALYGGAASFWAQSGSAIQKPDLVVAKSKAIDAALIRHRGKLDDPLQVMRRLGGRDIAAVAGAIIAARYQKIPVVLDGFVAAASAAVLHSIEPSCIDHCIAGAVTFRDSHHALLDRIGKKPVLDLGMGLGDGSGAALAISILKAAAACHSGIGKGQF
ncbi:MAG: nicotinate-nucleotide--dimethylbenzimidazole phosphoribosyltransferase [Robiginitomaculum sp.]|nr:nicotinate-nucleotide--dimethylbenzimidazole phosphoribosyltransferase [Robiginitomaculum sp.]